MIGVVVLDRCWGIPSKGAVCCVELDNGALVLRYLAARFVDTDASPNL